MVGQEISGVVMIMRVGMTVVVGVTVVGVTVVVVVWVTVVVVIAVRRGSQQMCTDLVGTNDMSLHIIEDAPVCRRARHEGTRWHQTVQICKVHLQMRRMGVT